MPTTLPPLPLSAAPRGFRYLIIGYRQWDSSQCQDTPSMGKRDPVREHGVGHDRWVIVLVGQRCYELQPRSGPRSGLAFPLSHHNFRLRTHFLTLALLRPLFSNLLFVVVVSSTIWLVAWWLRTAQDGQATLVEVYALPTCVYFLTS